MSAVLPRRAVVGGSTGRLFGSGLRRETLVHRHFTGPVWRRPTRWFARSIRSCWSSQGSTSAGLGGCWSTPGLNTDRLRSEAAFAMLWGGATIPGPPTHRRRLNRGGIRGRRHTLVVRRWILTRAYEIAATARSETTPSTGAP